MKKLNIEQITPETIEMIRNDFLDDGIVVINGLKLNPLKFEQFTYSFCNKIYTVSSRYQLIIDNGDDLTTTTPQSDLSILAHSEATYSPYPITPDIGFLMCVKAPKCEGGETSLGDGVEMLQKMPQELANRFQNEKIIYEYLWEPLRYQAQFEVNNQEELIKLLNTIESIKYSFIGDNVHIFYKTSAIIKLSNGDQTFSNAILGHLPYINHPRYKYPYIKDTNQVYWEDGEILSQEEINTLINLYDSIKYSHQWQDGDIVMFDNIKYMHSKEETNKECERKLLARFGYFK